MIAIQLRLISVAEVSGLLALGVVNPIVIIRVRRPFVEIVRTADVEMDVVIVRRREIHVGTHIRPNRVTVSLRPRLRPVDGIASEQIPCIGCHDAVYPRFAQLLFHIVVECSVAIQHRVVLMPPSRHGVCREVQVLDEVCPRF